MNSKNVLIIGAHYDDAELGVGGTAAKLAIEGKTVYKLTLTDNETDFRQWGLRLIIIPAVLAVLKLVRFWVFKKLPIFKLKDVTNCSILEK